MASAMILAAGLGTRLRPLTDELPKPLVPVGDRPLVAHAATRLAAAGFAPLVVNTHHLAPAFDVLAAALGLLVSHEPSILGTAGGVARARARGLLADDDVLVWNGDLFAELDVQSLLRAHREGSALATLAVSPRPRGEGTLGLSASGDVVRLRGERFGEETRGADFMGAQTISSDLVSTLPSIGCLVGDAYLPALRKGARLTSFDHAAPWRDVGTLRAYLEANLDWLKSGGHSSFVAEGAAIEGAARLDQAVIGRGASVHGRGALRRVVVWPFATAHAPLEDAIVTSRGVVEAPRTL